MGLTSPPFARLSPVLFVVAALGSIAAHAQSFDDLMRTGRAQLDSGKSDDAVRTFEKAVKANPRSADAHVRLGDALGNVAQKANVLRQPFLARRLKSEFEKAVDLDANSIAGREGLLQFYLQAPGVMGGSLAKAREEAAAIAKISAYSGHFADATIASHEKDDVAAENAYRAAFTEYPDSIGALSRFVNFATTHGHAEDAFPPLDRFLAGHPNSRAAQFWIGRAAAVSGQQLDRGEQMLTRLLATANDSGPRVAPEAIHYRLGDIAAKRGDKTRARSEYSEALKINPKFDAAKKALAAL